MINVLTGAPPTSPHTHPTPLACPRDVYRWPRAAGSAHLWYTPPTTPPPLISHIVTLPQTALTPPPHPPPPTTLTTPPHQAYQESHLPSEKPPRAPACQGVPPPATSQPPSHHLPTCSGMYAHSRHIRRQCSRYWSHTTTPAGMYLALSMGMRLATAMALSTSNFDTYTADTHPQPHPQHHA